VDSLTGSAGNDTFVADNSGTNKVLSAADAVKGGGGTTDTLKVYNASADALDGLSFAGVSAIANIYTNSGTLTHQKTLDVSAISGATSLEVDSPVAIVNAKEFTFKTTAAQTLVLNKVNVAAAGAGTANLSGVAKLTLNATGASTTDTGTLTLDVLGTTTALAINTATAASKVTLANTGAALTSVTVTGDQGLTLTSSVAIKTIDASKATGKIAVDVSGATIPALFAFTGGTAADTLTLKAGALDLLTAGSQLNGGSGNDTLVTKETATLTTAQLKAINAAVSIDVLSFGASGSGVDVSKLTTINSFGVLKGNFTAGFTNATNSSSFLIDNAAGNSGTVTIGNKVGETATTITVDNGIGSSKTLAKIDVTGISTVALSSTGVATLAGGANVLTDIVNSDNSSITIKGDTDLTITNKLVATAVGSKVDAAAFTGKLVVIGSDKADVIIGGTGADTLAGAAADKGTGIADKLTGGAGADTFVFTGSTYIKLAKESAGTTAITHITDFVAGTDKIKLVDAVSGTAAITLATAQTIATAADLTAVYAGITAISASSATGGQNGVVVTVSAGAAAGTYLYINDAAGAGVAAADDMLINLTGITGTLAATDFVFA
jgi:hypothetical protein